MTNPRQGPFIQELFIHDRATRRRLVLEALELGATAIGVVLWEPFSQSGRTQPFVGRDLAAVKKAHLRKIRQLVRWCGRHGAKVYLYGLMGPWARRGDTAGYRYQGREIPGEAWRGFNGDARDGYLRYLIRISRFVARLEEEGEVGWVDGVEPFFGPNRPGPPPNAYQEAVQEVVPGAFQYVAQGQWGEIFAPPETHVDPGYFDRSGHGGGILATDGWGRSTTEWEMPDGRTLRFAGLPVGETRKEVVAYYADLYRDAAAMGREALLVLHTAQWDVYALNGGTRAGIVAVDVDPWGAIYRRLATLQEQVSPAPADAWATGEIRFLHRPEAAGWPASSSLASVRIDPERSIELRHSMGGRWPAVNGVEGNCWVVARIGGELLAWTWEWMRPGQALRQVPGSELGPRAELQPSHPDAAAVHAWRPGPGEEIGFFVSSHARHGPGTVDQRSNIVSVRWPS